MTPRIMLEEPVSYTLCSMALPRLPEPPQLHFNVRNVDLEKAFGFTRHGTVLSGHSERVRLRLRLANGQCRAGRELLRVREHAGASE